MAKQPMLDQVELQQVDEVETEEREVLEQHSVPALEGDFLQDLGRRASRVTLTGTLTGPAAGDGLKSLRETFRAAEPVPFVEDIATATKVDKVLIEEMDVRELAGKPESFEYALTLLEFSPPPETAAGIDTDIAADAEKLVNNVTGGLDVLKQLASMVEQLAKASRSLKLNA